LPLRRGQSGGKLTTSAEMNITMASRLPELQQSPVRTVLVVEDDPHVRMPIAEYLRDCGYDVLEAGDACQAMALIDGDGSIGLVFSDVRMPGSIDGFGLAHWLRRNHPDIPVLLTSGYTDAPRVPGDSPREVPLIGKPYSQGAVADRIEKLLSH